MAFKLQASGGASHSAPIDLVQVKRAMHLFLDPDQHVFLQALPNKAWACVPCCELTKIEDWAVKNQSSNGLYFGINPIQEKLDRPSRVADVAYRRWILVDIDRNKTLEPDNPATENEHEDAKELAFEIQSFLGDVGFPAPIQVDSANGFHLYYRINFPNDNEHRDLIHEFLLLLANTFDGDRGQVGSECFDSRRISRIPGTWSRRGKASKDRPYRQCQFVYTPKDILEIPVDVLRQFVGNEVKQAPDTPTPFELIARNGTPDRIKAYGLRALDLECGKLAGAAVGQRNNQLFKSTAAMFQLVAAGAIDGGTVKDQLFIVAVKLGLDEKEIIKTLESGKAAGTKQPRELPKDVKENLNGTHDASANGKEKLTAVKWTVQFDNQVLSSESPNHFQGNPDGNIEIENRTFRLYTMGALMREDFPDPKWVVSGILSEGLNLLAGKPKQGKSMLALNLAITIAGGGMALGDSPTTQGDVIYLSLEDKARRVKARAAKMLKKIGSPQVADHLTIATEWQRQHQGGLKLLDCWFKAVRNPSFVIIDVWGMFKESYSKGGSQYEQDYSQMSEVKRFLDRRNCSGLILVHCRKGPSDDVLEEVSGTMGLTGVADGVIVLNRLRNDKEAKIFLTGRDFQEKELLLEFDDASLTWKSMGEAKPIIEGALQGKIIEHLKTFAELGTPDFVASIAKALGESDDSVRAVLHKLKKRGLVRQVGKGWAYPGLGEVTEEVTDGEAF